MFAQFEYLYAKLVRDVLNNGEYRKTRNAVTKSIFGVKLTIDMEDTMRFPILQGRKMYYKGVLGEFAALVRGPKHVQDFEHWGCNYWKKWADADGNLVVDYGNEWLKNGQIDHLKYCLANNHTDRRMLINGWNASNLAQLSLPCCHYSYQFYVRDGGYLDMIWNQRSADLMIGAPSDIILAYTWLVMLANEFDMKPGRVHMMLGDVHIYESHLANATRYMNRVLIEEYPIGVPAPKYTLTCDAGKDFLQFEPCDIKLNEYDTLGPLEFKLYE